MNGSLAGSIAGTPVIAGMVGIGQVFDPAANFDLLTGTIIGVAVYEAALSAEEIAAHSRAYVIPEPGRWLLLLLAGSGLALARRA